MFHFFFVLFNQMILGMYGKNITLSSLSMVAAVTLSSMVICNTAYYITRYVRASARAKDNKLKRFVSVWISNGDDDNEKKLNDSKGSGGRVEFVSKGVGEVDNMLKDKTPSFTIVVIGGLGLLGANIVKQLLKEKAEFKNGDANPNKLYSRIIVFDSMMPSLFHLEKIYSEVPKEKKKDIFVEFCKGSIENQDNLDEVLSQGVDLVIHCASLLAYIGITNEDLERVNIQGARNVISSCKKNKVRGLISTSSLAVLLDRNLMDVCQTGSEDITPYPKVYADFFDHYGYTKRVQEEMVLNAHIPNQLHTICLRPGIIFAEDDRKLSERLLDGFDNVIIGNGENVVDFIDSHSVATAHVQCVKWLLKPQSNNKDINKSQRVYNIGSGYITTVKSFYSDWGHGEPQYLPQSLLRFFAHINVAVYTLWKVHPFGIWLFPENIDILTASWVYKIDAAREDFGYMPDNPIVAREKMVAKHRSKSKKVANGNHFKLISIN